MKHIHDIIAIGLMLFCPCVAYAQNIAVSGKVTDENGEGLPGASVSVKDSKPIIGTQTNIDGNFELTVPKDAVLVFSFVGYERQEIAVGNQTLIHVQLAPDAKKLEDVVVTGYRQVAANEFAGSAVKLKADDMKIGGVASIDQMLQGQAAGVSVQATSSVFGTTPKIRIRGSSSITGINQPLWVLDGVVLESPLQIAPSELFSGGAQNLLSSALGGINPNDIQDITILKDATATALYGTRAVNGVIVITTKRAKRDQKLQVDYVANLNYRFKPSISSFDVLNSEEEVKLRQQLYTIYEDKIQQYSTSDVGAYGKLVDQLNRREIDEEAFRQGMQRIKSNNTDWFDVLFRNSIQQQYSISASYGGKRAVTRASLSYMGDGGYSVGQKVERVTFTSSSKFFLSGKFSVETLIKYADRTQRNPSAGVNPYSYAATTSRAMSPYTPAGELEYYNSGFVDFNILQEINNAYIDAENSNFILQFQLQYQPIKSLNITVLANKAINLSTSRRNDTEKSAYANSYRVTQFSLIQQNRLLYRNPYKPSNALPETILPQGGILRETNAKREVYTFRGQASWDAWNNDTHHLNLLAGTEVIINRYNSTYLLGYGHIYASGISVPDELALIQTTRSQAGSYYSTKRFFRNQLSFYGGLNYTLLDKYILTGSLRNDANNVSSTARNRFLPTWTVAGAWSLGKEAFMESLGHIFSSVKLRASYGLRGNASNVVAELQAYPRMETNKLYPKYNQQIVDVRVPANVDIEYEKEYIFSGGIEATLFNRLNVTAECYRRENFDLLGTQRVAPSLGYRTKTVNWATMLNEGAEFSLSIQPIKIFDDLRWQGMFNIGYNKNTVVSNYLYDKPDVFQLTGVSYPRQGRPLTGFYAFRFAGLDSHGRPQFYNSTGEKVYGFKINNRDDGNIAYQGSRDPLYFGGFGSTLRYKNLTLSVSCVFNLGNAVRKGRQLSQGLLRDISNISGDHLHRWKVKGDEQYTTIPRLMGYVDDHFYMRKTGLGLLTRYAFQAYNQSDIRTVDASFLRIRMVSLKYQFPNAWVQKLKLGYLTVELQAVNPAVFASGRLRGQDPETAVRGTNIPPITSANFNVSVGF